MGTGMEDWYKLLSVCENEYSRVTHNGPPGKSIYKGVCSCRDNRWRVVIYVNSKQVYIGTFDCEIEAAKAYEVASTHLQLLKNIRISSSLVKIT